MSENMIDGLIEAQCPPDRGGWVPSVEAHKIIEHARQTVQGRHELADWLDEHAETFMTAFITKRKPRSRRSRTADFERTLAWYTQHSCAGGVVKMAHEMTRLDHEYVAKHHGMLALTNGMLEAFHNAVAKKIGDGQVTSDVFDQETYQQMLASITGIKPVEDEDDTAA